MFETFAAEVSELCGCVILTLLSLFSSGDVIISIMDEKYDCSSSWTSDKRTWGNLWPASGKFSWMQWLSKYKNENRQFYFGGNKETHVLSGLDGTMNYISHTWSVLGFLLSLPSSFDIFQVTVSTCWIPMRNYERGNKKWSLNRYCSWHIQIPIVSVFISLPTIPMPNLCNPIRTRKNSQNAFDVILLQQLMPLNIHC